MTENEEKITNHNKKKFLIPVLLLLIAIIAGVVYYMRSLTYVSTDDAYISGHSVSISPKISGNIIKISIDDNQQVKKGQLLVEIDPADYEVKYEQAVSTVEGAKAQNDTSEKQIEQAKADLDQLNAEINSVKSQFVLAKSEFNRSEKLYKIGAASKQDFDRVSTNYDSAKSKLDAYNKKISAAQKQVSITESQSKTSAAQIKQLLANVKQAKLNLSYTKIYAPESGIITGKNVEKGVYVQTGQPLFAIVPEERWIVANFKETQLTNIRKGQEVNIKIDTYPNKLFKGEIESIQASTGSAASLFPPENAVGSFVKVVQRVPVKIIFTEKIDPKYVIVPGMSVIPEVKIK